MPAMHYHLRWPDGLESACYSPSLVIKDFFEPGKTYPLATFLSKVREATQIASDRVRAKYGFACSMAADQLHAIEAEASRFADTTGAQVEVIRFDDAA